MRFPRTCKILKSASRESGRYAFDHVHYDGTSLVATTGRILAVVPIPENCRDEYDVAGLIPREAIELALKVKATPAYPDPVVLANGSCKVPLAPGAPDLARPEGEFPKYEAVIPPEASITHRISLNPRFLLDLAEAIGAVGVGVDEPCITLELNLSRDGKINPLTHRHDYQNRPIRVKGYKGFGLIMPILVDA